MRLLPLFLFILFGFSSELKSQDVPKEDNIQFEKYAIGISPTSFFNFYSGLQISNDIGLSDRFNLSIETAYLFKSVYRRPVNGIRIKPGFEFILHRGQFASLNIGVHGDFRYTKSNRKLSVFHRNYSQDYYFNRSKFLYGGEIELGLMVEVSDRIRAQLNYGLGYGSIMIHDSSDISNDFRNRLIFSSVFDMTGKQDILIAVINLNFSYVLVKSSPK